jgi:hypothetical protein
MAAQSSHVISVIIIYFCTSGMKHIEKPSVSIYVCPKLVCELHDKLTVTGTQLGEGKL